MLVKLFYEIDKAEAIKLGKSEWGQYEIEIDPAEIPEDLREEAARFATKFSNASNINNHTIDMPNHCFDFLATKIITEPLDNAGVFEILRWRIREREAALNAETKKREQEQLARECELARLRKIIAEDPVGELAEWIYDPPPDVRAAMDAYKSRRKRESAAADAERQALRNQAEKKRIEHEKKRAELRRIVLTEAIELAGDKNTRERNDAGLLGADEESGIISYALFSDEFAPYRRLRNSDVAHEEGTSCDYTPREIEYSTGTPSSCTREDWDHLAEIREAHKPRRAGSLEVAYTATLVDHVATCEYCAAEAHALSVRVGAIVDGIEIATKHFAITD